MVEVLHAEFAEHAYPAHTHDAWTLLIVDAGAVRFDLDRHEHGALRSLVTLLPPHVPHDGRNATPAGFRKRVVYLEAGVLGDDLVGAAVDRPGFADPLLRDRVSRLHRALAAPGEELAAESRLALAADRLRAHLLGRADAHRAGLRAGADPPRAAGPDLAGRLRELIDARSPAGIGLGEAAELLGAHPTSLVRAFTARFGLPPHRYLTGRRIDLARRLLLDGRPVAEVAAAAGFFDQAHLTRHFRRMLGTPPASYARP